MLSDESSDKLNPLSAESLRIKTREASQNLANQLETMFFLLNYEASLGHYSCTYSVDLSPRILQFLRVAGLRVTTEEGNCTISWEEKVHFPKS